MTLIVKGLNLIPDTASRMRTSRSKNFPNNYRKRSEDEFFQENPAGSKPLRGAAHFGIRSDVAS
jgi:hypothetical protein